MGNVYGYIYARTERDAEQQKETLKKLSIPERNIFVDKIPVSGRDRPMLRKMGKKLQGDDLVYIKSLNWLGNTYEEILEQWQYLTKKQKADVAILDMPLLDTRRNKDIMGTFLSDVVTEMLSYAADNERNEGRKRQTEVYLAAKARGAKYGRPSSPLPENFDSAYHQWKAGEISGSVAARECGMPLSSFRYRAQQYESDESKLAKAQ